MGVRGLKTFMDDNRQRRRVRIEAEIRAWKSENPGEKPTIILDILELVCTDEGILCGGSCREFDELIDTFFNRLVNLGVELVFVQKLTVEIATQNSWIKKKNQKFETSLNIYRDIENGDTVPQLMRTLEGSGYARRVSPNLIAIASKYGEYLFVPADHHCDQEVAREAKKRKAIAIMSTDTDFLIFEGQWKWWNFTDLDVESLEAWEYDRSAIERLFSLTWKQRPLLATLIGNKYSNEYYDDLFRFLRGLGKMPKKFENAANYIRRSFRSGIFSEDEIGRIARDVFGYRAGDDKRRMIRKSLESYRVNEDEEPVEEREIDPIEFTLSGNALNAYRKLNIKEIQAMWFSFFDMPSTRTTSALIEFFIEVTKKKMGIVHHDSVDGTTFKLLMKSSRASGYAVHEEEMITPDVPLPPLIELLTNDDNDDADLKQTRWNLLAWLLSITADECDKLRSIDKDFRLPCATLLVFVKRGIMTKERADGVLVTEMAFKRNQLDANGFPELLNAENVRAAHIYRIFHAEIMYTFLTVGLTGEISEMFRFDSVYYQNLMAAEEWPQDLVRAIDEYRIYAE